MATQRAHGGLRTAVELYMTAGTDPFGRARVSNPTTQIDAKQLFDNLPLFFDDAETSGGGTGSVHSTDRASTVLSVGASTAGTRVRQSRQRGIYQTGKGLLVLVTGVIGGSTEGITKRWGYFDGSNGIFFQHKDGTFQVVRRSSVTGTAVDTVIDQLKFNADIMDGTGTSAVKLDTDKANIYGIDIEWLGVGGVRMFVVVDNQIHYLHYWANANNLSSVYISNPNLPIRYEITNGGTADADDMECICATVISEGGNDDIAKTVLASRAGASITLANQDLYTPIVSVRLKPTHLSAHVTPVEVAPFLTTNTNYHWRLFINPTVAGTDAASWTNIANSAVQFDVSRDNTNTLTGGYVIADGYGASSAQVRAAVAASIKSYLTIGSAIDGTPDEMVLGVANIDANGGTAYGSITLGEFA